MNKCNEVSFVASLNEIRYYELSIASGEDSGCSSDKEFSTNLAFDGDKHEKTITIQKSVKNITIGNEIFESKLIEKYLFCVRAVVMDVKTVNYGDHFCNLFFLLVILMFCNFSSSFIFTIKGFSVPLVKF